MVDAVPGAGPSDGERPSAGNYSYWERGLEGKAGLRDRWVDRYVKRKEEVYKWEQSEAR